MTEGGKRNNLMREGVGEEDEEEERRRRWWRRKRRSESEARGMREERSWWGGKRYLRVKGRGTERAEERRAVREERVVVVTGSRETILVSPPK
jgi:hypothetical protein